MARRLRLACRRHLAVLGAAGRHRHADRPAPAELAGAAAFVRRPRDRGHLHASRSSTRSPVPPNGRRCRSCGNAATRSWRRSRSGTRPPSAATSACRCRPAPMISLTVGARGRLHPVAARPRPPREVAVVDFVTGNHTNVLQTGELLRSIHLPASALSKRFAVPPRIAHPSRTLGGAADRHAKCGRRRSLLTITAATPRPSSFASSTHHPRSSCGAQSTSVSRPTDYFDDVHGSAAYKRHLTHYFAEQIRAELA